MLAKNSVPQPTPKPQAPPREAAARSYLAAYNQAQKAGGWWR